MVHAHGEREAEERAHHTTRRTLRCVNTYSAKRVENDPQHGWLVVNNCYRSQHLGPKLSGLTVCSSVFEQVTRLLYGRILPLLLCPPRTRDSTFYRRGRSITISTVS